MTLLPLPQSFPLSIRLYEYSFSLGIYGDNTEAKFNEFKGKLEAAGLDKVTEAMKTQYEAFAAKNQ